MSRRLLRCAIFLGVLCGLGGLGYWALTAGQSERQREEARELSIKVPPRRTTDPTTHEVVIRLDTEGQQRMGIVVQAVARIQRQKTATMLGFSVLVPHRAAEVRSPWTGIFEPPGDGPVPTVGQDLYKGQVLGNLRVQWSPADRVQLENQLREVEGTIGETAAELEVARNAVERLGKISEGTVAEKQLAEAEGNLAKLNARLIAAKQREGALREALAKQESLLRFEFVVPQGGQLVDLRARPGEVVAADSLVATIYDPQDLWARVLVLPGQLPLTSLADLPQEARLTFPGFSPQPLAARLVRVNPQSEPGQQAVELVYAAKNPGGVIPVGLQAAVEVPVGRPAEVLAMPRSAVVQMNDRRLVYLQRRGDEFIKLPVVVQDEAAQRVYVLPPRDAPAEIKVVVHGAQTLLSEEYKEAIQLVEESGKAGQSGGDTAERD